MCWKRCFYSPDGLSLDPVFLLWRRHLVTLSLLQQLEYLDLVFSSADFGAQVVLPVPEPILSQQGQASEDIVGCNYFASAPKGHSVCCGVTLLLVFCERCADMTVLFLNMLGVDCACRNPPPNCLPIVRFLYLKMVVGGAFLGPLHPWIGLACQILSTSRDAMWSLVSF